MSTINLLTKLKGEVSNPALDTFGHIQFVCDTTNSLADMEFGSRRLAINTTPNLSKALVLRDINTGNEISSLASNGTGLLTYTAPTKSESSNVLRRFADIKNKNAITSFVNLISYANGVIFNYTLDDFYYLPNLTTLIIGGEQLQGDLAEIISKFINKNNFDGLRFYYTFIRGDIKELGILTKLTSCAFNGSDYITGNIEDLVEAQVENGRVSGNLAMVANTNTKIIFHGNTGSAYKGTIIFNSTGAEVRSGDASSSVLGTYSNGQWTYA